MKLPQRFLITLGLVLIFYLFSGSDYPNQNGKTTDKRPNILFCIADDWGWPHAGVYGDAVVQTPVFDKLAKEGLSKAFELIEDL